MNMSEQELKIGDIGYKFRKKFDEGWFTGSVVSIRPGAGKLGLRHDMHVFLYDAPRSSTVFNCSARSYHPVNSSGREGSALRLLRWGRGRFDPCRAKTSGQAGPEVQILQRAEV